MKLIFSAEKIKSGDLMIIFVFLPRHIVSPWNCNLSLLSEFADQKNGNAIRQKRNLCSSYRENFSVFIRSVGCNDCRSNSFYETNKSPFLSVKLSRVSSILSKFVFEWNLLEAVICWPSVFPEKISLI